MQTTRWMAATVLTLCGALASAGEAPKADEPTAQVAPELTVAAWLGSSVGLEDFKGQVTAVVFFNDSRA